MKKLILPKVWGGVVAAHQVEGGWNKGGKGSSICDVLTGGAHGFYAKSSSKWKQENTTRTLKSSIFMVIKNEDIKLFAEMASNVFVPLIA